jgi:hypothetical protein
VLPWQGFSLWRKGNDQPAKFNMVRKPAKRWLSSDADFAINTRKQLDAGQPIRVFLAVKAGIQSRPSES